MPHVSLLVPGIEICAPVEPAWMDLLTPEALALVADLARRFEDRRQRLLAVRRERQAAVDAGLELDFPAETAEIRAAEWTVAPVPADLQDRRVEITGPVDRKMIINALNSGANVFMADFEDSTTPTWSNLVEGQLNLRDAARGDIRYTSPDGREYVVEDEPAVLMMRPRGWHLDEKHVRVDGRAVSASLFDFGLYFFHCARTLMERGSGPYLYLPKLESRLEAVLWNDVFVHAQAALGIPRGTIRATVLVETIHAAFEMDEILHALREHSAGLNCGRWDYIFSFIKTFRNRDGHLLPDRSQITMDRAFLDAYVRRLIATCHRRGVHAMGGMAAQIPVRGDAAANEAAFARVRADKLREVRAGHDGTWVAHPGLVAVARTVFDAHVAGPNQIRRAVPAPVTAPELVSLPAGDITREGMRWNVDVGIQYLAAWLGGTGCVPIHHLMEDAATVEIARTQLWQWVHRGARFGPVENGRQRPGGDTVSAHEVRAAVADVRDALVSRPNADVARVREAAAMFEALVIDPTCAEFLTHVAYQKI